MFNILPKATLIDTIGETNLFVSNAHYKNIAK